MISIMKPNSQFAYHAGPPLLLPALSYALLFAASLLSGALLRHGAPFVNPYGPAEAAQAFFAQNFAATRCWASFPLSAWWPIPQTWRCPSPASADSFG